MGIVRRAPARSTAEIEGERHDLIGPRHRGDRRLGIALVPEGAGCSRA